MRLLIYVILFLSFSIPAFAQPNNKSKSGPVYTVKYHYNLKKKVPDSLKIWSYPSGKYWDSSIDYKAIKVNDSTFTLKLPMVERPLLLSFRENDGKLLAGTGYNTYYAETNDRVKIDVYPHSKLLNGIDSLTFSGIGAAKYTLAEDLIHQYFSFNQPYIVNGKLVSVDRNQDSASLTAAFKKFASYIVFRNNSRAILISKAKDVSPKIKKLISYNAISNVAEWNFFVQQYYPLVKVDYKLNTLFKQLYKNYVIDPRNEPDELTIISPTYRKDITWNIKRKLQIMDPENKTRLPEYYNELKNFSTVPAIREAMLTEFLMTSSSLQGISDFNPKTYDSLALDASKYLLSPAGKDVVDFKIKFKKGNKLFDGAFIDLSGNLINTASLRGKVFLLESWAEGCSGCVTFHAMFEKEIWPELKENKDFVVLSVYRGLNKERWLRGIKSSLYTSEHYTNVASFYGSGNHPLFAHYEVNYDPFILLVDKQGNIIANINKQSSRDLMKMIHTAVVSNGSE